MKVSNGMITLLLFVLILLFGSVQPFRLSNSDTTNQVENGCGYSSCPSSKSASNDGGTNILNVHLIAHSHDDTGWLKTVDQYYLGSNRARFSGNEENQRVGVQYVLDSVIKVLMFNPDRR